jgi:nuclear pore complex protein Nup188
LSGHLESATPEQISQFLLPRIDQLRNVSAPFGKPSDKSRQTIEGGSVTLPDGVVIQVDTADKDFVFAISAKFQIDQVQALVLLRSFLYNEGLPSHAGSDSTTSLVDELVEAITPFHFAERLSILRVLIPLFRANENASDPIHDVAVDVLAKLLPDGRMFAESLIVEYVRKIQEKLPESVNSDPRKASRWAKQNNKEQLTMLEVLFWTMWGYVSCDGPLVLRILEVAYSTNLGSKQQNSTLLLDDEGVQLQQDCAALWILITVEVLELEQVAEPGAIEISANPRNEDIYISSPDSLKRIHELVLSHSDGQHAFTYMAWAFVLSRLSLAAAALNELPDTYKPFFDLLSLDRSPHSKDRQPLHVLMSRACLGPEVGLFRLMLTLLTNSPLFVTAVAWRTGSTVTDPNAIAFRSVLKGSTLHPLLLLLLLIHSTIRVSNCHRRTRPGRTCPRLRLACRGMDRLIWKE